MREFFSLFEQWRARLLFKRTTSLLHQLRRLADILSHSRPACFIPLRAHDQQGKMEVPTWVDIVKTASFKELAPYDPDWFYIRAASMARKLYVSGNMGVGAFRKNYGGAKNDGVCRFHHAIGSGSVARAILKQLESVGVVEKGPKGRRITPSGQVRDTVRRRTILLHHLLLPLHKSPTLFLQSLYPTSKPIAAIAVSWIRLTPCCHRLVFVCASSKEDEPHLADSLFFSSPFTSQTFTA